MRLGITVVLLGVALVATARAELPPQPTWGDWVGDYTGKLAWRGCGTPGEPRATVALDAVEGAMSIELVNAGGGLRAMSLVEEERGWSAQSGDVKLRITRARPNTITLDAEVGSDCRLQATLVRPTTKHAACDRLIGWTRIESKCAKSVASPLEDPAKLMQESRAWKTRAKGTLATCEKRATKLAWTMVDVGCAPMPDPQASVPGPRCQALDQALGKLRRCGNLPPDVMRALDGVMSGPRTGADATTRAAVELACSVRVQELARVAADSRCPI